ncbi:MAG: Na+/H+ antiporter subunit E [Clostridia bacterium]|nr:Na+/H+ antiporter subunit E [Clostridia bacterium]
MYLLFFLVWVIFNGNLTLEIAVIGLIVAAAVFAFVCAFMDHSIKKEVALYRNAAKGVKYVIVLVIEIFKANGYVMKMILTEREEPVPALVYFKSDLKTKTGRALLANAITLTPGTITVMLEEDDYLIHCLDTSLAVGMSESVFVKMLREMENVAKQALRGERRSNSNGNW